MERARKRESEKARERERAPLGSALCRFLPGRPCRGSVLVVPVEVQSWGDRLNWVAAGPRARHRVTETRDPWTNAAEPAEAIEPTEPSESIEPTEPAELCLLNSAS